MVGPEGEKQSFIQVLLTQQTEGGKAKEEKEGKGGRERKRGRERGGNGRKKRGQNGGRERKLV